MQGLLYILSFAKRGHRAGFAEKCFPLDSCPIACPDNYERLVRCTLRFLPSLSSALRLSKIDMNLTLYVASCLEIFDADSLGKRVPKVALRFIVTIQLGFATRHRVERVRKPSGIAEFPRCIEAELGILKRPFTLPGGGVHAAQGLAGIGQRFEISRAPAKPFRLVQVRQSIPQVGMLHSIRAEFEQATNLTAHIGQLNAQIECAIEFAERFFSRRELAPQQATEFMSRQGLEGQHPRRERHVDAAAQ